MLAVFCLTVLAAGSYVLWLVAEVDRESIDLQASRIQHAIDRQLDVMTRDQQSMAIWSAALEATRSADFGWLQVNIGDWTYHYYKHHEAYILDADDQVAYASQMGVRMGASSYDGRADALRPLVDRVRAASRSGTGEAPHAASDYVLINGVPSIAGVMTIVTDAGEPDTPPGAEPLLVSVSHLDFDYETSLIEKYQMEAGRFTILPRGEGMATLPILTRQGRIIAFYEWAPEYPGRTIVERAVPAVTAAIGVLAVLVAATLLMLWRSSAALETRRLDAERIAREDALTGLPNRLSMEQYFDELLRDPREAGRPVWMLMLDLDRFKQVNDTFGHHTGDDLIRAVARRIAELLSAGDHLSRLGGDEFAIITRRDADSAAALGARIISAISRPFRVQNVEIYAGVSIGAVMATHAGHGRFELARQADIALYEAKSAGRNRMVVYEEAMDEEVQNRHEIEAELRDALRLEDDELWLAYQPLFSAGDMRVVGAEALIRWSHPRLGLIPPARFIPIAESSGLIERLGRRVMRQACEVGARWPGMTISVNVSPAQLRHADFVGWTLKLLKSSGMRPSDLELEITEGILLDDEHSATRALDQLRAAGIRIALDDFGTGYSSLNYLKRYPVDRIKIDRSFVSPLENGSKANAIVEAMITLAHALDIVVTAEGVETAEQRDILAGLGCNTLQGYLLSPPMSLDRLERAFAAARGQAREIATNQTRAGAA